MRLYKALIAGLALFSFLPGTLCAESRENILIVNSDASVEKYRMVHNSFKKAVSYPIREEIDLSMKKWSAPNIEPEIKKIFSLSDPNVVYCIGTKAYGIAGRYAPERNILFSSIINWLRLPITKKTYGISNELHPGVQLNLFRYVFPDIGKIGVLYSRRYNEEWFEFTVGEAENTRIKIVGGVVAESGDCLRVLNDLLPQIDAFWLISDPAVISEKKVLLEIMNMCHKNRIPIFSYHEAFVKYGSTLIVSVDNPTIGRQAAGLASDIIRKVGIADPVHYPAGSRVVLNLGKIKDYGQKYNKDALDSVNKIIE